MKFEDAKIGMKVISDGPLKIKGTITALDDKDKSVRVDGVKFGLWFFTKVNETNSEYNLKFLKVDTSSHRETKPITDEEAIEYTKKIDAMNFGLTVSEKKQLLSLLDKIKANHCKNYDDSRFDWNCTNKFDNQVCPFEYEYENNLEAGYMGRDDCFYCPVFLIRSVLGDVEN